MPPKTVTFEDGSRITWKDRETLQYEERGYVVNVWVDYEPGIFRSGRVLKMGSLERWQQIPNGSERSIPTEKKAEIVEKVRRYFGRTSVRVE